MYKITLSSFPESDVADTESPPPPPPPPPPLQAKPKRENMAGTYNADQPLVNFHLVKGTCPGTNIKYNFQGTSTRGTVGQVAGTRCWSLRQIS